MNNLLFIGEFLRFLAAEHFLATLVVLVVATITCAVYIHRHRDFIRPCLVAYILLFVFIALIFSFLVIREYLNEYEQYESPGYDVEWLYSSVGNRIEIYERFTINSNKYVEPYFSQKEE